MKPFMLEQFIKKANTYGHIGDVYGDSVARVASTCPTRGEFVRRSEQYACGGERQPCDTDKRKTTTGPLYGTEQTMQHENKIEESGHDLAVVQRSDWIEQLAGVN